MKEESLELACRGGRLLVSESRVTRRGTATWSLWRSQVTGVACAFSADERPNVHLYLRDGRRFTVEEIAPRACFHLFDLLGYESESPARDVGHVDEDDAPLMIDLGNGQTRVVAGALSVTLERDGTPLWVAPRDQLLGVGVTAGTTAATVRLVARDGSASLLENVPFAAALRLLVALGAAPAETALPATPPATPRAQSAAQSLPQPAPTSTTPPPAITVPTAATGTARPPRAATSRTASKAPSALDTPTSASSKTAASKRAARRGASPKTAAFTTAETATRRRSASAPVEPPPASDPPARQPHQPSSSRSRVAAPAPTAALKVQSQPPSEVAGQDAQTVNLLVERHPEHETSGSAMTVPQAAVLLGHTLLAAGTHQSEGLRAKIASAAHPLTAKRWAARLSSRAKILSAVAARRELPAVVAAIAVRRRWLVLVAALLTLSVLIAGDTLAIGAPRAAHTGTSVSGQMAAAFPTRAAMTSNLRTRTILVASHRDKGVLLDARARAIRWHDSSGR